MHERFHVPDNYFLSHSVGCLPKPAPTALDERYVQPWMETGGLAWSVWMEVLDDYRSEIADLLGTRARNICPQTNVSSALTKIIHSLRSFKDRKTILCSEADFPTVGFVLKQAERAGFRTRFIEGDVTDPETWIRACDDSVGVIHITHAFSNTSRLSPVADLCSFARDRDIVSIVDVAQSVGILPIHLDHWRPDFVIGTGVKFLCCGPGACFLYASDDMLTCCEPLDVGWFSHEDPFEFDIHDFRYADSAMRFFGGTPSPAPFVLANAALKLWREVGWSTARACAGAALDELVDHVADDYLISPRSQDQRGGTLVISPPDRTKFAEALEQYGIRADERREGFRFSVHGYTPPNAIESLKSLLYECARRT